jgi:hypothetical protein
LKLSASFHAFGVIFDLRRNLQMASLAPPFICKTFGSKANGRINKKIEQGNFGKDAMLVLVEWCDATEE